jgi:hypothetical protein
MIREQDIFDIDDIQLVELKYGAEPTLRVIINNYFGAYMTDDEAEEYTEWYIKEVMKRIGE